MKEKIGIVICSRVDSKRCPNKPFLKVEGKYIIAHLLDRLISTGIQIYVAVPEEQFPLYEKRLADYLDRKTVFLFKGSKTDPLKRTAQVATHYGLDHVIRVTHDKIFLNYKQIDHFVSLYLEHRLDYIYSTNFIPGMGFEIFSTSILKKAHQTFANVEHLSYAVESVAKNVLNIQTFPFNRTWLSRKKPNSSLRLLIDYPEDVTNVKRLMARYGTACDITDIVQGIENAPQPNSLPDVTVYTCSFEDYEFLDRCIKSVLSQSARIEYILIDDGSTDTNVFKFMKKYAGDKRVKVIRNEKNVGLASSSNIATEMARGRYVIRLDADDHFVDEKVIHNMLKYMEFNNTDILYPNNYKDGRIQEGCEQHHVGGTMFKKRTLDFIRFTDGLRHFDGLDLYYRAMMKGARVDYFSEPTFYYRQRPGSMSKSNLETRQQIEQNIKNGVLGKRLLTVVGRNG